VPIRVFELARDLCISSKDLMEKCRAAGFEVKGHMSVFDDHQARLVTAMFPPPSAEEIAEREAAEEEKKRKAAERRAARAAKKKAEEEAKKKAEEEAAAEAEAEAGAETETVEEEVAEVEAAVEEELGATAPEAEAEAPAAEAKPIAKKGKKKKGKAEETESGLPPILKPIINFPRIGLVKPADEVAEYADVPPALRKPGPEPEVEEVTANPYEDSTMIAKVARGAFRRERRRRARPPRPRRRGKRDRGRGSSDAIVAKTALETGKAEVSAPITARSLSEALGVKSNSLLQAFMQHGMFPTINDVIPEDVAMLVAIDYGIELSVKKTKDVEELFAERVEGVEESREEDLVPRSPVVAFLGHVDHGKTSLLDAIRKANVVDSESGGITQHIGAYVAQSDHGSVTFLDTPGHRAFTEMRARGANSTDIVVLVVAADDGVMPQTEEAISHAKAAEAPMVVALNKMDLPRADAQRVKQQLSSFEVYTEEWGGQVGVVEVSAETGQGLPELVERLALEAEMLELKGDPTRRGSGVIIEGRLSQGKGVVANMLVRDGTLRRGDVILSGSSYGRVRMLYNDRGEEVEEAGPSMPVEVTGLGSVPEAGARFHCLEDLDEARRIAQERESLIRQEALAPRRSISLEAFFSQQLGQADKAELLLILKADVKGSLEVIRKEVVGFSTDEAEVRVIHSGLGAVNATDVALAEASGAVVMGFHVAVDPEARREAEAKGVDVRLHTVIYDLTDEVKKALEGRLAPEERENVTAHLEVRNTFNISRVGKVAGCQVLDGTVSRSDRARLTRNGEIIHEGRVDGLKRFKDDVREVREGFECGLKITGYDDVQVGDVIETFQIEQIARTLD